jgi:glycosyltransferase involved in cell wall biosynthesis
MNIQKRQIIDVSVIITSHAESILIHRTIASVRRAILRLNDNYSSEIILHVDSPTESTLDYISIHKQTTLKDVHILQNSFGDLGLSRNYAIKHASGKYIAIIDADDLMSANWLKSALDYLEQQSETTVAHSKVTVEFEGADSLIIKHGEIDLATDTLLCVYANRWNSVIVAPRSLLLEEPYITNSPGYGYEDWHLNCRLIAHGVHNVLIPETAIFVRRKTSNSEWLRQLQSMAILRANPLLAFNSVRKITNPFKSYIPSMKPTQLQPHDLKAYAKKIIKRYPLTHKIARRVKIALKRQELNLRSPVRIPAWLQNEWHELHEVDRQIFPSRQLMGKITVYDTITEDHKKAGSLYKAIVDKLHGDHYDYLIFIPWLIKGGADRFAINYANTIAELQPNKKVLVVATLPIESTWTDQLDNSVDFLDFGNITREASPEIKYRLMGHLIENGGVTHIHIINSEFGYDFVRLHEKYIRATDKKVIITSFSQSIDKEGRLYGYSHTHVPFVYDITSYITSDNQKVLDMWEHEYGFDPTKMAVHHQPIAFATEKPIHLSQHKPLRVLWAARIAPEKQPELLRAIGLINNESIIIDIYGTVDPGNESLVRKLPKNVYYKGGFDGFNLLPLNQYDAFLYTSLFDGMPTTILEAAQAKIPIVASAVGGIPEFIINKKTGLLISDIHNPQAYADALKLLCDNPKLGAELSEGAYKKLASDFSSNKYRQNVKQMLKRLGY